MVQTYMELLEAVMAEVKAGKQWWWKVMILWRVELIVMRTGVKVVELQMIHAKLFLLIQGLSICVKV